jgi:hypothetical protein
MRTAACGGVEAAIGRVVYGVCEPSMVKTDQVFGIDVIGRAGANPLRHL